MEREEEVTFEEPESVSAAKPGASKRLRSILESLLFAAGDPVPLGKLVQLLAGYEKRDIVRTLGELGEEYARDERGFRLQQVAGGDQPRTSPAHPQVRSALPAPRPARMTRRAPPPL